MRTHIGTVCVCTHAVLVVCRSSLSLSCLSSLSNHSSRSSSGGMRSRQVAVGMHGSGCASVIVECGSACIYRLAPFSVTFLLGIPSFQKVCFNLQFVKKKRA